MDDICVANNQFTISLVNAMGSDQNMAVSPLAIFTSLAMIYLGAKGTTESQLKQILHLENDEDTHSALKDLIFALNIYDDYVLDIISQLFVDQPFNISQTYLNASKTWYNSEPEKVNFRHNPENASKQINEWIKEKTGGMVKDWLGENSISADAKLVVINTMNLLANWTQTFPHYKTDLEPFTLSTNELVTVEMMSTSGTFRFRNASDEGVSILQLPYGKNQGLSLFIVLPEQGLEVKKVEKYLDYEKMVDWTNSSKMEERFVDVYVPHIKINGSVPLKDTLSKMGMPQVFSDKANFSGIAQGPLYVYDVIHKAYLKIGEDGLENEDVNADDIATLSLVMPDVAFKANRAFLFIIHEKATNCVLLYDYSRPSRQDQQTKDPPK
ncbi:serpin B6-like [Spea bombifrons]|uniref:serpin B6-like n=1 Tax=Spea bombifrons TaxID=233779 RepID=UPI00234B8596|nr:serpin B6-like [Spea bombifrons]